MSKKYDAFGTVLQVGNIPVAPATQVFINIAALTNIDGPNVGTEERDATTHDSPNGGREKRPGFLDAGSVDIEGFFDPADPSHIEIITAWRGRQIRDYKILMVDDDDTTDEFKAFVTAFKKTQPHDNLMGFTATLTLSEVPAVLAGQ